MRRHHAAGVAVLALALSSCGSDGKTVVSPTPAPTTEAAVSPSPTFAASPSPRPSAAQPAAKSAAPKPRKTAAPRNSSLLVERLNGVGNARQVISVVASGYGTSYATLHAFTKTSSGWDETFGPWSVRIGRRGFAPPGDKREGDLRTPSGSYGFQFMFGVRSSPGVRYEYRRVTGDWHVWADDPGTPRYNLWSDTRVHDAGPSPEPLNVSAYNYSAVIAYNTARTSGLGSAIFMHVSTGGSTAGCVSLPTGQLLDVLRWLDPSKAPRIVMGTESYVT